ncbi:MAG: hypothetical protein ABII12_12830 [Planctomycetota bacterium]
MNMRPGNEDSVDGHVVLDSHRRPHRNLTRMCGLLAGIVGAGLIIGCPFFQQPAGAPVPQIALQVLPARGPTLGGTEVLITRDTAPPFEFGAEVLFGAFRAAACEVVDEDTIRVKAPAQAAGRVDVAVRGLDGTTAIQAGCFEYVAIEDADADMIALIETMFPGPPSLVSAVALNNTSVRISFSEPVRQGVTDTSNYSIIIPEGGFLMPDRSVLPEPSADHMSVDLTTLSQADVLYQLTVTDIRDLAGNQIAPTDRYLTPSQTTFNGIAPAHLDEHIDSDGDGFADWFEMLGWEITIQLANGEVIQGYVTSDPYNPDTDGDGLSDADENAQSTDPRTDDTDADLVPDIEELFDWRSNPCDQDTDDDGFADQTEVFFGTSLILADTDGDQLDDRDELLNRNRNPRIADLPIVTITVGDMNLELDERYSYTDQFGEEHSIEESFSDTLQRDTNRSFSETNGRTWAAHGEAKATFSAGENKDGPFIEVGGEVGGGFSWEDAHSATQDSSESVSNTYNEAVNKVSSLSSVSSISRETVAARISAAVSIRAGSDIAFSLTDVEISVLQRDPANRTRLIPIATLVPSVPDAVYHVGPLLPEVGPLIFQNTDVFPSMVEQLMKDPSGLLFQVANHNITDELGRNFAYSGQEVAERTATVTIDFGNGESEIYRIATASRFNAQGRSLGISMADALRAIELDPWDGEDPELGDVDNPADPRPKPTDADVQTTFGMRTIVGTDDDGLPFDIRVVTRVRGVQDDFDLETVEPNKPNDGGFWAIFVTTPGAPGPRPGIQRLRVATNFDEARLYAGEAYIIAYVKDKDQDDLTSLEEFFAGSNDALADTDNDSLGDFLEIQGQWDFGGLGAWLIYTDRLPGGYRTYAAPFLSDSDGDGLMDDREYALCRYRYQPDGTPPADGFTIGTSTGGTVVWDGGIEPEDLPPAFPPSEGLPDDWHKNLDPETGAPVQFPTNRASLDPRKKDTDEDGISDADEVNGYLIDLFDEDPTDTSHRCVFVYTDPLSMDTDKDGLLDGMERQFGTNPVTPDSGVVFDDDLDGLPNRVEETGWLIWVDLDADPSTAPVQRRVFSNPDDPDSDNDYLPDYVEWVLGTNPWYDCDPADTPCFGDEPDPADIPPGHDTDDDGLSDSEEWDGTIPPQDQEKLAYCDVVPNCAGYLVSEAAYGTDPTNADTDGDELSDGDEIAGWNVHLGGSPAGYLVFSNPLNPDTDNDGWPDGAEAAAGSDPTKVDTDEDGTIDSVEASIIDSDGNARDPLTPDQLISITYHELCIGADGGLPAEAAIFYFSFGIWQPGNPYATTWMKTYDLAPNFQSCLAANNCYCRECGDWRYLRLCRNDCSNLMTYAQVWDDVEATKSFIIPHGDYFWIYGYLHQQDICDEYGGWPDYEWEFGAGEDLVSPITQGTFSYTTGPDTDLDGDAIEITVHGYILVE